MPNASPDASPSDSATDRAVFNFTQASADLLHSAMLQAQQDDPQGVEGLARALKAGATVCLRTEFAPATGLVHITVHLNLNDGQQLQLLALELQREPLQ